MSPVQILCARLFALLERGLARDERGAVNVEYIAVFATVTLGTTLALVKLAPALVGAWVFSQHALLSSKP